MGVFCKQIIHEKNQNQKSYLTWTFVLFHRYFLLVTKSMAPLIDKTNLFRDLLKSAQSQINVVPNKNRILKRRDKDILEMKAHDILKHTSELKEFLSDNREAYIDVLNRDYSPIAMSDLDRDKIDAGADTLIRSINGLLDEFQKDLKSRVTTSSKQQYMHLEAVKDILDTNLKLTCQVFSEQRAIRVKKELEMQKMSRLELKARSQQVFSSSDIGEDDDAFTKNNQPKPQLNWYSEDEADEPDELSPEEMQLFERENEKMYVDLMSLKDDIQQIETKVVKIAELQEIFTEKVLQQKDDINNIATNAISATENVNEGNEEIRKAIQKSGTIRVYVLFFLLVMSFTLLFLDWYNE